jgi:exosortase A-associated hydrolase 2
LSKGTQVVEFLGPPGRRVLVVQHRPARASGPCVIVVPPFAEEMNKSRRMVTLVAERLVQQGTAVLVPDLFGTGDSDGEFYDADWGAWKSDLETAAAWSERAGWRLTGMLAIRLGCLLGADWLRDRARPLESMVLWQPVESGERFLTQFLRLRVAASMMLPGKGETVTELRGQLSQGRTVEVAGYELSGRLAQQVDGLQLMAALESLRGAVCFEVVREGAEAAASPLMRLGDAARAQGVTLERRRVEGDPFWATTEIVALPALIEQSAVRLGPSS